MVSREEFRMAGEELLARREALMERAEELREQFAEHVDTDAVAMAAGLSLVSGGMAWGITQMIRGRRSTVSLIAPVLLVALGFVVASRGALSRRGAHILAAEDRVRSELAGLDPFARVRVLRDMASEQLPFIRTTDN
jgi:hypothetical protein